MIALDVSPQRIIAGEATELVIRLTNTGPGTCTRVMLNIRLPVGITRLRGREKIEQDRLESGHSVAFALRIRAGEPGQYGLTASSLSYRDHHGHVHRDPDFAAQLVVAAAQDPLPEPEILIEVRTAVLKAHEWSALDCTIVNSGRVAVSDLALAVSGPFATDQNAGRTRIGRLAPGASEDMSCVVYPQERGAAVPLHLDLSYSGPVARAATSATTTIRVEDRHTRPQAIARPQLRILMLCANPRDTRWLRLDKEAREIERAIRDRNPAAASVAVRTAVRVDDLEQALLDVRPHMIHLAGHGEDGTFVVEDDHGLATQLPPEPLTRMITSTAKDLRCVTVNACSTERLARALVRKVPYVIAMSQEVLDSAAIGFSIGFYRAIVAGDSVEKAFGVGTAALGLVHEASLDMPKLLQRSDLRSGED